MSYLKTFKEGHTADEIGHLVEEELCGYASEGGEDNDPMNFGNRKALLARSQGKTDQPDGEGGDKETVKRKSRNLSEKKRRDQFNMLINELCSMVSTNNRKLDKTTVLKSTITFLRNHKAFTEQQQAHEINENWKPSFLSNDEFTQLMLEALDSFLLVITQRGNILYASESVTSLLDYLPSDLVNLSIYDFIHPDERVRVFNTLTNHNVNLSSSGNVPDYAIEENQLSFCCHLRCGDREPSKSSQYKLVKCIGNFRRWNSDLASNLSFDDNMSEHSGDRNDQEVCFCSSVRVMACNLVRELAIIDETNRQFTSRHSMEWKFLFLDHRGPPIIGWLPFEVLGTSAYDYNNPDDLEALIRDHEQLMQTGKSTSSPYRFLTKGQQWIWLQTKYYITYHQWNSKPEFIVCQNTVVSYAEVRAMLQAEEQENMESMRVSDGKEAVGWAPQDTTQPTPDTVMPGIEAQPMADPVAPAAKSTLSRQLSSPAGSVGDCNLAPDSSFVGFAVPTVSECKYSIVTTQPSALSSPPVVQQVPVAIAVNPVSSSTMNAPMAMMPRAAEATASKPQAVPGSSLQGSSLTGGLQGVPQATLNPNLSEVQKTLHTQLWQKHQMLQQAILKQQEELQEISNQLLMSQVISPTAVKPLPAQPAVQQQQQQLQQQPPMSSAMTTIMPAQMMANLPILQSSSTLPQTHSMVPLLNTQGMLTLNLNLPPATSASSSIRQLPNMPK